MNEAFRRLRGANMDIDLATPAGEIAWQQEACPWNQAEANDPERAAASPHRCAVKNISICPYFGGVEFMDTLLCCYPHKNPLAG